MAGARFALDAHGGFIEVGNAAAAAGATACGATLLGALNLLLVAGLARNRFRRLVLDGRAGRHHGAGHLRCARRTLVANHDCFLN